MKNYLLLLISILLSVMLLEGGLRIFTVFPIHHSTTNNIVDENLGYRLNPSLRGIDEAGFRNERVLKRADIVALGDSFTYGYNIKPQSSWPRKLARMSNKEVYNFGIGGYGILQYRYLFGEAIKKRPAEIILALYLTNDLADVCSLMRDQAYWKNKRTGKEVALGVCGRSLRSYKLTFSFRSHLIKTAIGSMLHYFVIDRIRGGLSSMSGDVITVNYQGHETVITESVIEAHEKYMDTSRPEIAMAFEMTKKFLKEAKKKADASGITFSVLFIPPKEVVFYDYLLKNGYELTENYHSLVASERSLTAELSELMSAAGIPFVDTLPRMRELIESSDAVPLYPAWFDGHLLERGYEAIARAAYLNITK